MSKDFKKIATIVGVAALATTGIGLFVAGPLAAMGFGTSAGILSAATLKLVGAAGLALVAIGSAPNFSVDQTGANARGRTFSDPNALGIYAFGTTTVPAALLESEIAEIQR